MADYTQVVKVLWTLASSYPNFTLEKRTIDAYADLLQDIDADTLATAAKQAAAESKFFPTVAELRERALVIRGMVNGWPDAAEVFQSAVRQASSIGYARFDDTTWPSEAIRDFVKTWWRDICYTDEDNLPTIRAQFRDSYNARARRADQQARNLPGTNDMIKRLSGQLDANTPRLGSGK